MKIAVSSSGNNLDSRLNKRFGRCEYFVIYNTENKTHYSLENKGATSGGGAGIAGANQIIDEKVDVIVTGSLGPNSFEIITENSIKAYTCNEITITEVIDLVLNNELEEITTNGPAHSGMR